jgi:hypothetical protein
MKKPPVVAAGGSESALAVKAATGVENRILLLQFASVRLAGE